MTSDVQIEEIIDLFACTEREKGIVFPNMEKFFKAVADTASRAEDIPVLFSRTIVDHFLSGDRILIELDLSYFYEFFQDNSFERVGQLIERKIQDNLSQILSHVSEKCGECKFKHEMCHEIFNSHREIVLALTILDFRSREDSSSLKGKGIRRRIWGPLVREGIHRDRTVLQR